MEALLGLVLELLILGAVFYLLLWMIGQFPMAAPFSQIARGIVIVVMVVLLIRLLLSLNGAGLVHGLLR